ncbi:ribosome recycling factor domain-containing protein [Massariosphaeria phaeospora]|uniref:Ribosome recycling factor domain-containing protein n=1 Tax=Massariosphaeria phaeospora TaxID=100035 RepID=A0A7C8IHU6_9PLEO|nr:ribosome recycling factor domain-containing protein [Massariosphaeria phaeospora]
MSRTTLPAGLLRLGSQRSIARMPHTWRAIDSPVRIRFSSHGISLLPVSPTSQRTVAARSFTVGCTFQKKAGKANKVRASSDSTPPVSGLAEPTSADEAFDVSGLEAQVLKAIEKLTHSLSQLRAGGRLNPDILEGLRVHLGNAGKDGDGKETVKLGDIAQVVPRGRVLQVMCGEADHMKAVSTAIAASPHSLTPLPPQSDAPLTIQVPMPPPTGESRQAALKAAKLASEDADKWIQSARANHNKKLRKYQLNKSVLPDDLQKAGKLMEEVVKRGHTEVKRIADGAKRVLESQ